jgi:hypothetical protein
MTCIDWDTYIAISNLVRLCDQQHVHAIPHCTSGNFVIEMSGHLKLIDFGLSADGVDKKLNNAYNGYASCVFASEQANHVHTV